VLYRKRYLHKPRPARRFALNDKYKYTYWSSTYMWVGYPLYRKGGGKGILNSAWSGRGVSSQDHGVRRTLG
jgi:hypothetical protein